MSQTDIPPVSQRRHAPATSRNREPITDVLKQYVPAGAVMLEIAAGTGEHAAHIAPLLDGVTWQPTDLEADNRNCIDAWVTHTGVTNVRPAMSLNVLDRPWALPKPLGQVNVIFACNLIHIAPIEVCDALLRESADILPSGGRLILYGPYLENGEHTAPSNIAFEQWLKGQDERWGIRDRQKVTEHAESLGLQPIAVIPMPANNFSLVFEKA